MQHLVMNQWAPRCGPACGVRAGVLCSSKNDKRDDLTSPKLHLCRTRTRIRNGKQKSCRGGAIVRAKRDIFLRELSRKTREPLANSLFRELLRSIIARGLWGLYSCEGYPGCYLDKPKPRSTGVLRELYHVKYM